MNTKITPTALTSRFGPLPESMMDSEQINVVKEFVKGPRGKMNTSGPNIVLLRAPELLSRTQKVGEYLRFGSSLPARLSEFAIMITARAWSAQVEWLAHQPLALKAGLAPSVAEDLAKGKHPQQMQDDEKIVYQFCTELHQHKRVTDQTYLNCKEKFGEKGVVELIGITGYYTMLAMVLNVAQQPLPGDVSPPLAPID
ncbi:MAG: carboxymuconolactone decarboxylase family protein [Betaproteobacteria bacterium]|jgi:4-carboxymuconolactone decarboxylase